MKIKIFCLIVILLLPGCGKVLEYNGSKVNLDFFSIKAYHPNDADFGLQWNLKITRVNEAWDITRGSEEIIVATIDTGVDPHHPDLEANLLKIIDIWGEDGTGDLYESPIGPLDYAGKDGNGHGTHVAGIIGAVTNNSIGVSGIAGRVKILPIKAFGHQISILHVDKFIHALELAVQNNAKIINLSIGGEVSQSDAEKIHTVIKQIVERGIVIVAATGNSSDRSSGRISKVVVPAIFDEVIAVASTDEYDNVSNFSNAGAEVDIAAPGGSGGSGRWIYSTWPTYLTFEGVRRKISDHYSSLSGTSMACAHVSGIVALILSQEPYLTPEQIKNRLIASADDVDGFGFDENTGYGRVNAYKALKYRFHEGERN